MEQELSISIKIASNTPVIKRMWVFGSRLKQSNKVNSDLDIASELRISVHATEQLVSILGYW